MKKNPSKYDQHIVNFTEPNSSKSCSLEAKY